MNITDYNKEEFRALPLDLKLALAAKAVDAHKAKILGGQIALLKVKHETAMTNAYQLGRYSPIK